MDSLLSLLIQIRSLHQCRANINTFYNDEIIWNRLISVLFYVVIVKGHKFNFVESNLCIEYLVLKSEFVKDMYISNNNNIYFDIDTCIRSRKKHGYNIV